ncbi:hypothetical protein FQR65_LT20983 [Abscondita terminalis]|nr:hypothetical protein FQR65_LT20983 [Abscondita terminalis]
MDTINRWIWMIGGQAHTQCLADVCVGRLNNELALGDAGVIERKVRSWLQRSRGWPDVYPWRVRWISRRMRSGRVWGIGGAGECGAAVCYRVSPGRTLCWSCSQLSAEHPWSAWYPPPKRRAFAPYRCDPIGGRTADEDISSMMVRDSIDAVVVAVICPHPMLTREPTVESPT